MDRLPDEITLRIISFIATCEWQLLELEKVSRNFKCIAQDQTLWYQLFQHNFKNWGYHIPYACRQTLIDWRAFIIHLAKQKRRTQSLTFDFVPDEPSLDPVINRKRKIHELIRSYSSPSPCYKNHLSRHYQDLNAMDILHQQPPNDDNTMTNNNNDFLDTTMDRVDPFIDLTPPPSSILQTGQPSFDRESFQQQLFGQFTSSTPFHIQDPLVVDIDRATQIGVVATGKHRKAVTRLGDNHHHYSKQSEHKILFWDYPSWRLIRELEIHFVPPELTCQIVGVQTVKIKKQHIDSAASADQSYQAIRLFALAIGQPIEVRGNLHGDGDWEPELDDDEDDRVDLWQAILIYRLFDDGTTQCLANVHLPGRFMGREIFFFSDYSWTYGGDTNDGIKQQYSMRHWLQMVAPEHVEYDPYFTLFMLAIGPTFPDTDGCGNLIRFDLRGDSTIVDPALTDGAWNPFFRRIVLPRRESMPLSTHHHYYQQQHRRQQYHHDQSATKETNSNTSPAPAKIIHTTYLGSHVSCMIHFRYPTQLNHLICTGSYNNNELSVYDWRFGVKVGTLPWKTEQQQQQQQQQQRRRQRRHRLRNNRLTPLPYHNAERRRPPVPPPPPPTTTTTTQPDLVDENQLEPIEMNDAGTILNQILERNQRDGFDQLTGQMIQQQQMMDGDNDGNDEHLTDDNDDFEMDLQHEVRPWGLELTMALPPYWDHRTPGNEELAHRGFRLIAVGDNRMNRLEIKVWDISFLLKQLWNPLQHNNNDDTLMMDWTDEDWRKKSEWTKLFPWWQQGSRHLQDLALRLTFERVQWDEQHCHYSSTPFEIRHLFKRDPTLRQWAKQVNWPLSPPMHHRTMLLAHAFDRPTTADRMTQQQSDGPSSMAAVKYTAYNVLCTSLFLLTEDGKVTVMDIETGQVIGTIDNVVAAARMDHMLSSGRIRGIDINVVSGHEVVITSREGLLRSIIF